MLSPVWTNTIAKQKSEIADLLAEVPSLSAMAQGPLRESISQSGCAKLLARTMLPDTTFPRTCPWSLGQTLAFTVDGESRVRR